MKLYDMPADYQTAEPSPLFPGLKSTDRAPREEIQHRAYALWQSEGEPNSQELDHWLQAELEVMQEV